MDALLVFLGAIQFWHWLALGLVLLLVELVTGSTYLLWPAAAAWITGLALMLAPIPWPAQLALFAIASLLLLLFARPLVRGLFRPEIESGLNDRARALAGATGVAAAAFENGVGRVRLGDSEWRAISADAIAAGEAVDVIGVDGATLTVRRRS